MKNNIATSISQSRRLLACGVDPKTADMHWCKFLNCEPFLALGEMARDDETGEVMFEDDMPAWSLSALLELLPMSIEEDSGCYQLKLQAYPHEEDCYKWRLSYYENEWEVSRCYNEAPTPIEACVQMIEWLTEHNYSLNKTEE